MAVKRPLCDGGYQLTVITVTYRPHRYGRLSATPFNGRSLFKRIKICANRVDSDISLASIQVVFTAGLSRRRRETFEKVIGLLLLLFEQNSSAAALTPSFPQASFVIVIPSDLYS